eukprot:864321-Pelagomonas_calceolata.AAC.1
MGKSAFEKNVVHPAHHLGNHIDHKQGKQCHLMWPARLSRYGHKNEIEPHCGQCVWVRVTRGWPTARESG